MQRYFFQRLLGGLVVLALVSVLAFLMLHLVPGDPVAMMLGETSAASAADIERLRHQLGLDLPLPLQYLHYVGQALQGDLGHSMRSGKPVLDEVAVQLPATTELMLAGLGFAVVLGVTLGTLAAIHHQSWLDTASMALALLGVCVPSFWLGLMLIFAFSLKLQWFPAAGVGGLEYLVLPALTLGLWAAGIIARLTRSSMLEVLRQDYMNTARAKGLREHSVLLRHGMRNAMLPMVTIIGLQIGALMSGAVIVESVFARSGVGRLIVSAIVGKDVPLVQGIVLFSATIYVLVNLTVDLSYSVLDPRIRYAR